jgi:hypothetical protein
MLITSYQHLTKDKKIEELVSIYTSDDFRSKKKTVERRKLIFSKQNVR